MTNSRRSDVRDRLAALAPTDPSVAAPGWTTRRDRLLTEVTGADAGEPSPRRVEIPRRRFVALGAGAACAAVVAGVAAGSAGWWPTTSVSTAPPDPLEAVIEAAKHRAWEPVTAGSYWHQFLEARGPDMDPGGLVRYETWTRPDGQTWVRGWGGARLEATVPPGVLTKAEPSTFHSEAVLSVLDGTKLPTLPSALRAWMRPRVNSYPPIGPVDEDYVGLAAMLLSYNPSPAERVAILRVTAAIPGMTVRSDESGGIVMEHPVRRGNSGDYEVQSITLTADGTVTAVHLIEPPSTDASGAPMRRSEVFETLSGGEVVTSLPRS